MNLAIVRVRKLRTLLFWPREIICDVILKSYTTHYCI